MGGWVGVGLRNIGECVICMVSCLTPKFQPTFHDVGNDENEA